MTSLATPSFWRALRALSPADQQAARRAYRQFAADPFHNSLRWIGSHADFDNMFG